MIDVGRLRRIGIGRSEMRCTVCRLFWTRMVWEGQIDVLLLRVGVHAGMTCDGRKWDALGQWLPSGHGHLSSERTGQCAWVPDFASYMLVPGWFNEVASSEK